MAPMLNRRQAFAGLGGLAAVWAVPTIAAAQAAQAVLTWTPKALTPGEARTLAAACERIVPTTDTPGAIAAGVPQFVDRTLAAWSKPDDAQRLRAGLQQLDQTAYARFSQPFAALSPEQQDGLLREAEAQANAAAAQKQPHYFLALRELTSVGYFTSEVGATKALRYDPIPGAYHGCIPVKDVGRGWATS